MSRDVTPPSTYLNKSRAEQLAFIETACAAYVAKLPAPDPAWPPEIRRVVSTIHERLFDPELTVAGLREELRLSDNNVSGHFAFYVGKGVKRYIDGHRLKMARLLGS